ncbi:4-hydroxyphenylacetaldehyde oxime monooxygenase-like [Panicum virgatum]|uniref:4-hydroxyphenylacetaldehyde oxime monooxygenase-like n=1 Tax=Panicum virgatum TaxID=38727 RepID=UPI0019D62EAF|nr:4-hydroxyphenylacetaldehyde oxime monooxygenase-like [Panicum virgatum]
MRRRCASTRQCRCCCQGRPCGTSASAATTCRPGRGSWGTRGPSAGTPRAGGGADAEEFDPGRFERKEDDGVGFGGTHFELLPFGAGRRMCPGMALGVATVEFTLANLLYCFDWELPEGVRPEDVSMEEAGGLTVHKRTPLLLVPTRYYKSAVPAAA